MRRLLACVLVLLVGLDATAAWTQQGSAPRSPAAQAAPADPAPQVVTRQLTPPVDVLSVSFDRIRRELRTLPPSKAATPLKLEYYIEVIAVAPPFMLFAPDEPSIGPVPGTAPSHAEMVRHVTPQAFSAPVATLVSVGGGKGRAPRVVGQDLWQTQARLAAEAARRKRLEEQRRAADEAERERQRRVKESLVVSPPK